jgi:outer membrane protein OmpA-like peptidoglycan-associated protein
MKRLCVLLVVAVIACTHRQPPAPYAALPAVSLQVRSVPDGAVVFRDGKELGKAPLTVGLASFEEALGIAARWEGNEPVEVRLRMLSATSGELVFRFDEKAKAFAQRLGFARLFVLDTGSNVTFDVDQATLKPEGVALLARQAEIIKAHFPAVKLYACGHTDSTGSYEHNIKLSLARAEAVAAFLKEQGIAAERIAVMGFGADFPLESNDTPEGRAVNRRTELVLPRE